MSLLYTTPEWAFRTFGSLRQDRSVAAVERCRTHLEALSDDALAAECSAALGGTLSPNLASAGRPRGLLGRAASWFDRERRAVEPALALAVETFRRFPADLPQGSVLFPHQVRAAIALTQRCVLQMNTGEGKTYAALPAAFALATEFGRVYIVCANRYLAWRDATRTQNFWTRTGASATFAFTDSSSEAWLADVVYTTIADLVFTDLSNEQASGTVHAPLRYAAVILDEIDAIVLDQGGQRFQSVIRVSADAYDWSSAIAHAATLAPEEIAVDHADLTAALTQAGEVRLRAALPDAGTSQYLLMRYAVELAYIGNRVAEENRDYVLQQGRVIPVDRRSGQLEFRVTPDWALPIEFGRGTQRPAKDVVRTRTTPTRLLDRFAHMSGMSGSASDDFLDYILAHGLLPLVVPPRERRVDGLQPDSVYRTRAEADRAAVRLAHDAVKRGSPVLIGTQTIEDAERVFEMLRADSPSGASLQLLTGKDEERIGMLLRDAGEVGSLIVATQLVGRGVDIRLSSAAKVNGGLTLIALGHALELRHDHQFLGRAGRQGDPFRAQFIVSLDDDLMKQFGGHRIKGLMASLGMEEDVAIDSPVVDKAIRRSQRQIRRQALARRHGAIAADRALSASHNSVRDWFDQLRVGASEHGVEVAPSFVDALVADFLDRHVVPAIRSDIVDRECAERIVVLIARHLEVTGAQLAIRSLDLEGRLRDAARDWLASRLVARVQQSAAERRALERRNRRSAMARQLVSALADIRDAAREPAQPIAPVGAAAGSIDAIRTASMDAASASLQWVGDDGPTSWTTALTGAQRRCLAAASDRLVREFDRSLAEQAAEGRAHHSAAARSPRAIASESLIATWSQFLAECDRDAFRILQQQLSWLDHYRRLSDTMRARWRVTDDMLSAVVLKHLVAAGTPERLDDLFTLVDKQVAARNEKPDVFRPAPLATTPRRQVPRDDGDVLAAFVSSSARPTNDQLAAEFSRVVLDFAERSPASRLQDPPRVLDAIRNWTELDIHRGVGKARRALHRTWIRQYLLYLRQRNLIGALPTLRDKTRWTAERAAQALTWTTIGTLAGLATFFGAFFALSMYVQMAPVQLDGAAAVLDRILAGGLFAEGALTAPAFPVLLVASALVALLFPRTRNAARGSVPLETMFTLVLQVSAASVLAYRTYAGGDGMAWLAAPVVFAGAMLVMTVTRAVTVFLHNRAGLALDQLWLAGSVAVVFLPWLATQAPAPFAAAAVFCALVIVNWTGDILNSSKLMLASSHIAVSGGEAVSVEVVTPRRIAGNAGFIPLLFGLLFYQMAHAWLSTAGPGEQTALWGALSVYGFIMGIGVWTALHARTRAATWIDALNHLRQFVVGIKDNDALAARLRRIRWRLFAMEMLTQAIGLTAAAVVLGLDRQVGSIAAAPLAVLACALFASMARPNVVSLAGLLTGYQTRRQPDLDLSRFQEPEVPTNLWSRVRNIKDGALYRALGALLVISQVWNILQETSPKAIAAKLAHFILDLIR